MKPDNLVPLAIAGVSLFVFAFIFGAGFQAGKTGYDSIQNNFKENKPIFNARTVFINK